MINFFQHFIELSSKHGNSICYAISLFIITFSNIIFSVCDKGNALVLFVTSVIENNFKGLKRFNQFIHFHGGDIVCFLDSSNLHIKSLGKRSKELS
ncbi:hypothetical protein P8452_37038 [Trifolium repens]|nr:hypothetical protein P8452_37038 [Trifolium repens]